MNATYNLIRYQILHTSLQDFICMECSACHKNVLKRQKCRYFDHPLAVHALETAPSGFGINSRTRDFFNAQQSGFAGKNISCLDVI